MRRPFRPSPAAGPYRLPHDVRDRLVLALAPFKNREAALTLAVFLARYHTAPGRLGIAFSIDRRALLDHGELDLTEKRIRSAITTLEAIGYLERPVPPSGSRYKATEHGLHRKPIKFVFAAEYSAAFHAANKRGRRAKGGDPHARRPVVASPTPRPSTTTLEARSAKGPKNRSEADNQMNLGPLKRESGIPAEPSALTALELALQRLSEGVFGKPRGFQSEGNK